MIKLLLENKTGFVTSLPFTILDNNNILFYDDTFTDAINKGKPLYFNIPAGKYFYNGSFLKLDNPVKSPEIVLPPKERNIEKKEYKIIYGDNPNKCTIFYDTGIILFDNSFKTMPLYIRYGIYFHELGHHYYKSEDKADLFGIKKMFEYGFNISQIGRVGLFTLSDNSYERKEKMINKITKKQ